jgi:hypothetical protein
LAAAAALVLSALGSGTLNPPTATFTIPPGSAMSETNKTVTLPTFPSSADIELAIDTTGSMGGAINEAVAEANAIVSGVQAEVPDSDFAVIQFKDSGFDPEYAVVQSMTPSAQKVHDALATLFAAGGGDLPEAYNQVFHSSYPTAGNAIGWRTATRKFVIVIGDAQPHGSLKTVDGYSACTDNGPDPDGLDTKTELAGMNGAQLTLIMLRAIDTNTSVTLACYQQLAAGGYDGSAAADLGTSGIAQQIVNLINAAFSTVRSVHLEVDSASPSPAVASWISLPPAIGPVSAPGTYPFGPITISVPAGTPPNTYMFDLVAKTDTGQDIGHEKITVTVPTLTGLTVCKKADNGAQGVSFNFTVLKGKTTVWTGAVAGGSCMDVPGTNVAGNYTVAESATAGWALSAVATNPASALISSNLAKGTAKVTVTQNAKTEVDFTNNKLASTLKVCKWSGDPSLQGAKYTFTLTGGVSKTVTPVAGPSKATAGCSTPIQVATGASVTVTEAIPDGQVVAGITVGGSTTLAGSDLKNGVANLTIGAGLNKVVYEDEQAPQPHTFKVCKRDSFQLEDGNNGVYNFTATDNASPPHVYDFALHVDECTGPMLVTGKVTVTEAPAPFSQLQQIVVQGATAISTNIPGDGTQGGSVVVPFNGTSDVEVDFYNIKLGQRIGTIEICKKIPSFTFNGKTYNYDGLVFTYIVNGLQNSVQVASGHCSPPLQVPLNQDGTATITELPVYGFAIQSITTQTGGNNPVNVPVANPANVAIPEGPETVVTYTNRVLTAGIKVCKLIASGSEASAGTKDYSFTLGFSDDGFSATQFATATVHPPYPGSQSCTGVIGAVPVVVPFDGGWIKSGVVVTEISPVGTAVQSITVDNPAPGSSPSVLLGHNGSIAFLPGAGVDVVTFTNKATNIG